MAEALATAATLAALSWPLPSRFGRPSILTMKRNGGLRFIRLALPRGRALSLSFCVTQAAKSEV